MKRTTQPNRESTVSDKFQAVIPKALRKQMRIRRGVKLRWMPVDHASMIVSVVSDQTDIKKGWAERMYGLGAEVWKGVDAMDYINELRDDWTEGERERGIIN